MTLTKVGRKKRMEENNMAQYAAMVDKELINKAMENTPEVTSTAHLFRYLLAKACGFKKIEALAVSVKPMTWNEIQNLTGESDESDID